MMLNPLFFFNFFQQEKTLNINKQKSFLSFEEIPILIASSLVIGI